MLKVLSDTIGLNLVFWRSAYHLIVIKKSHRNRYLGTRLNALKNERILFTRKLRHVKLVITAYFKQNNPIQRFKNERYLKRINGYFSFTINNVPSYLKLVKYFRQEFPKIDDFICLPVRILLRFIFPVFVSKFRRVRQSIIRPVSPPRVLTPIKNRAR